MNTINKWNDLKELFDILETYCRGYIVMNKKCYYKYQEKIEKIKKDNFYKKDEWKGNIYILKNWKL